MIIITLFSSLPFLLWNWTQFIFEEFANGINVGLLEAIRNPLKSLCYDFKNVPHLCLTCNNRLPFTVYFFALHISGTFCVSFGLRFNVCNHLIIAERHIDWFSNQSSIHIFRIHGICGIQYDKVSSESFWLAELETISKSKWNSNVLLFFSIFHVSLIWICIAMCNNLTQSSIDEMMKNLLWFVFRFFFFVVELVEASASTSVFRSGFL